MTSYTSNPRARSARMLNGLVCGFAVVLLTRVAVIQVTSQYRDDARNAFVRGALATAIALPSVETTDGVTVVRSVRVGDASIRHYSDSSLVPLLGVIPRGGYPTGLELGLASDGGDPTIPRVLTIDAALQSQVSSAIGAEQAAVLVLDLDGSVVAAVDRSTEPVGDVNTIASTTPSPSAGPFRLWEPGHESVLFDRPVAPGSTLKPLLIARAYDAGLLESTEVFPAASGYAPPGGRRISNYAGELCPAGDVVDGLARSCNSTALTIVSRLTPRGVRDALASDGFGTSHDASRPTATSMTALADGWPGTVDEMSLSIIGQGEARVTLLDLGLAYAGLAAGTRTPSPRFWTSDPKAKHGADAVSDDARKLVLAGMAAAADHGTARALHGLDVVAKTGTATRDEHGNSDGWVVVLAPAIHPTHVVVVRVDGSTRSASSGEAARIAARIVPSLP